jgi:hypothetical protein
MPLERRNVGVALVILIYFHSLSSGSTSIARILTLFTDPLIRTQRAYVMYLAILQDGRPLPTIGFWLIVSVGSLESTVCFP